MVKCTKYGVVRICLHDARVLRPVPWGAYPVDGFLLAAGHHGVVAVPCGKQCIHASFRRSMHAPVAIVNVTVYMVVEGEPGEMRRHNSHARPEALSTALMRSVQSWNSSPSDAFLGRSRLHHCSSPR